MTDEATLNGPEWVTALAAAALARMDIETLRFHRQQGDITGYDGVTGRAFGPEAALGGYLLRFKRSEAIALAMRIHPWLLEPLRNAWRRRARCRGMTNEDRDRIFYPEQGKPYTEALSYCRACPVRRDCLEWATMIGVEAGMFGGATGPELVRYNLHWRRTGVLPRLCEECGKTYSNATAYCSQECAHAGD